MLPTLFLTVVLAMPSSGGQSAPVSQQVCGAIVDMPCVPSDLRLMTLLVQPGVSTNVDAPSAEIARAIRGKDFITRGQRACVSGQLVQRQTAIAAAKFAVDRPEDVVANGPDTGDWPIEGVAVCEGLTAVTVKQGVRPAYTRPALDAHIQGIAIVQAIVGVTGQVERVRLLKSLDSVHGLDEEALKAAKQWTFNPATRAGTPVRTQVTLELTFQLRK